MACLPRNLRVWIRLVNKKRRYIEYISELEKLYWRRSAYRYKQTLHTYIENILYTTLWLLKKLYCSSHNPVLFSITLDNWPRQSHTVTAVGIWAFALGLRHRRLRLQHCAPYNRVTIVCTRYETLGLIIVSWSTKKVSLGCPSSKLPRVILADNSRLGATKEGEYLFCLMFHWRSH